MENYLMPIETAFLFFPIVAFFITLPYMIIQYRKYGSIPMFRSIVVYSFTLYLMCAYFLIILPLPPIEEVSKYTTPVMQLVPFQFVADIIKESSFRITDIKSYVEIFTNRSIYQVLYNIILMLPFGFYLRYYFKCNLKKTICYSFLLSLFFELTQLSGLYGIYPRSYRLFDVDDLMLNTLGGMVGYFVMPIFAFLFPSKEKLDRVSYARGKSISYTRRMLAFSIDMIILLFLDAVIGIVVDNFSAFDTIHFGLSLSYVLSVLLYFVVLPKFYHNSTIGKRFLKVRIGSIDGTEIRGRQILIRYGLLYLFYLPSIIYAVRFLEIGVSSSIPLNFCLVAISLGFVCVFFYFWFHLCFSMIKGERILCYERISNTKNVSTIEIGLDGIGKNEDL